MPHHTEQPIKLALLVASIAALSPGCVLGLDKLDAGLDDDSAADGPDGSDGNDPDEVPECLIGSELDATGVELSSWTPQCNDGVVCAEGWGHDGDALPIAWTSTMAPYPPDSPFKARAIGRLDNGFAVVALAGSSEIFVMHFDPVDGAKVGGYIVDGLGSVIHDIEVDSHRIYVTHGNDDGLIEVSAIDSQQLLWTTSFAADWGSKVARGGAKLALTLWSDPDPDYRLAVLDLDGNVEWEQPADPARVLAIAPAGDRIAASGEVTRIYDADDGQLLAELDDFDSISVKDSLFLDQDRLALVGAQLGGPGISGWVSVNSLVGADSWEQSYDRASSWCADQNDEHTRATNDSFAALTRLGDGSLVAVGTETFVTGGEYGNHPWVARFSADGEFLGRDRGLWYATGIDTVAGPDGSVYVLMAPLECDQACEYGSFAVRKYEP